MSRTQSPHKSPWTLPWVLLILEIALWPHLSHRSEMGHRLTICSVILLMASLILLWEGVEAGSSCSGCFFICYTGCSYSHSDFYLLVYLRPSVSHLPFRSFRHLLSTWCLPGLTNTVFFLTQSISTLYLAADLVFIHKMNINFLRKYWAFLQPSEDPSICASI